MMSRVLGVSRSGFYGWTARRSSLRACEVSHLGQLILGIHQLSRGTHGRHDSTQSCQPVGST
jgi:hypothetical protein